MSAPSPVLTESLAAVGTPGGLDAILYLKRNGQPLACWTRRQGTREVLAVMAATLLGSMDTMLESMGTAPCASVVLATETSRILLEKVGSGTVLLLAAPVGVSETQIRGAARKVRTLLPAAVLDAGPGRAVRAR